MFQKSPDSLFLRKIKNSYFKTYFSLEKSTNNESTTYFLTILTTILKIYYFLPKMPIDYSSNIYSKHIFRLKRRDETHKD